MIIIVYFQRYHIELAQTVINFTFTIQRSFHWTSANFSSVTPAMQEKPSFANKINMSLSKIPFNFRQPQFMRLSLLFFIGSDGNVNFEM